MKVKLVPAAGAIIHVHTKDGRVLNNAEIDSIEVEPFFSLNNGLGEALHGEVVTANGVAADRFAIAASGANGKVKRVDRVIQSVIPLIDRPKKTAPATPPTAKPPENKK